MKKKVLNLQTLVERAVIAAVANVRSTKWRNLQMRNFAVKYGNYQEAGSRDALEDECVRIVRSAGTQHARRLLAWFNSVRTEIGFEPYPRFLPVQRVFEEMKKAA